MTSKQLHQMIEGIEKAILKLKTEVSTMEQLVAGVNRKIAERAKLQGGVHGNKTGI